jgi:hypothetical protein
MRVIGRKMITMVIMTEQENLDMRGECRTIRTAVHTTIDVIQIFQILRVLCIKPTMQPDGGLQGFCGQKHGITKQSNVCNILHDEQDIQKSTNRARETLQYYSNRRKSFY